MAELTAAVIVLVSLVLALIAFDSAALAWGVDSREPMGDDHARLV